MNRTAETIARIIELRAEAHNMKKEYKGFWIHLNVDESEHGTRYWAEVGDEAAGATCFETDSWASWRSADEECETWIDYQTA